MPNPYNFPIAFFASAALVHIILYACKISIKTAQDNLWLLDEIYHFFINI